MKPNRYYLADDMAADFKNKTPTAEVAGRKLYWFEWRAFAGWRQSDVAAILGVTSVRACRIENGTQGCTLANALMFADALGISIDELFRPPPPRGQKPAFKSILRKAGHV